MCQKYIQMSKSTKTRANSKPDAGRPKGRDIGRLACAHPIAPMVSQASKNLLRRPFRNAVRT
ncbi:MAG: hypothetical protein Q7T53_06960 [Deltaproteobacteria bacterium]|nr:hypothetical protein [Deltaproteobacteria bacterium]